MQHCLTIDQLSVNEVHQLVQRALQFKQTLDFPRYPKQEVVTLFYENSTRTRVSFELAAHRLAMSVVNLDLQASSEAKGETIDDTFQTLMAMGFHTAVIRHQQDGLPTRLAERYGQKIKVVNAGDGQHAHPTQALLDLMTIMEKKPNLAQLKVVVVGDLRHSRVANSWQQLCALMEVGELVLVAPEIWQPRQLHCGRLTTDLAESISNADVVMGLRVQRERLLENEQLDLDQYRHHFALTQQMLARAKPDVMVMHPGPMNRGIEIDSEVADGAQAVILQQVQNGVFMRMAILEALAS